MKPTTLLLVHAGLLPACRAQCYYANHKVATTHFPCDPDAAASPCCLRMESVDNSPGHVSCLENNLCQIPGPNPFLVSPACTSAGLGTPLCPNYCLDSPAGVIKSCGTDSTHNLTNYCCLTPDTSKDCCEDEWSYFPLGPPNPQAWATWAGSSFTVIRPRSTSSAPSAASSSSSISSSTSPAPAPSTSSPAEQQDHPHALSTAAQAGISVGAALGALLVAAVAYLVWKLNRQKKMMEAGQTPAEASQLMSQDYDAKPSADHKIVAMSPVELPAQSVMGELSALSPAVQRDCLLPVVAEVEGDRVKTGAGGEVDVEKGVVVESLEVKRGGE